MLQTFIRTRVAILALLACIGGVIWWPQLSGTVLPAAASESVSRLAVHFLDVGQGDAIFIETPDGVQVLVDGGASNAVLRELAQHMQYFDTTIDMVVATHPDTDHVGGLVDVFERYQVDMVLHTENTADTSTAQQFTQSRLAEPGATQVLAQAGQVWQLGASTTMRVLWPVQGASNMESNRSSIVLQVVYGDTEILLTGDAPESVEEFLVMEYGTDLESEVLKLGHHGSKTSSNEVFLEATDPQYAIVSAGKDNRYGHPHPTVLSKVEAVGAAILSTIDIGTISLYADGRQLFLKE